MTTMLWHGTVKQFSKDKYSRNEKNYRRRNEFLVNQADCLLAVYDNDRSIRSGTGMTVNLAKKKRIPVICIHPDTGIVSE